MPSNRDIPSKVAFDARWVGDHGIGRYATELDHRLPAWVDRIRSGPRFSRPSDPYWLRRELRRRSVDLLLAPGYSVPPAWSDRTVCIPTVYDLIHLAEPGVGGAAKRAFYQLQVFPALRRAPVVLTVSEHSASLIERSARVASDRIVNVGTGISEAFVPGCLSGCGGRPSLLAFYSPRPHKAFPILVDAVRQLGDLAPQLRLVGLDRQTCDVPVLDGLDVVPLGGISDLELAQEYRNASAVVVPSLEEGLGLPVVEAVACAAPVVASGIPTHVETVGDLDVVTFVRPGDPRSLADAIRSMLHGAPARELREQAALIVRNRFDWDQVYERVALAVRDATGADLGCGDG